MVKAWRNIESNNGKRPSRVPAVKHADNWLINGLLIHAGYVKPAVPQVAVELPYSEPYLLRKLRQLLQFL